MTVKTIGNWKKQFLNNISIAFEPAKTVSEFKDVWQWHSQTLYEIKELTTQNDELAKATLKTDFSVKKAWA